MSVKVIGVHSCYTKRIKERKTKERPESKSRKGSVLQVLTLWEGMDGSWGWDGSRVRVGIDGWGREVWGEEVRGSVWVWKSEKVWVMDFRGETQEQVLTVEDDTDYGHVSKKARRLLVL